jgi:hypothetical protein
VVHVLVGQATFVEPLQQAASQGDAVAWIVPKAAEPGDDVLLFFPHAGFLGRGEVVSKPEATDFGRRQTYRADVGHIMLFPSPIALDVVAQRFPEWAWARYPRSFTTPQTELGGQIFAFVQGRGQDHR